MTSTTDLAAEYGPDLITLRRELHKVPELDRYLPKTQALVLEALGDLDLEITTGEALSSVTAVLRGRGGPDSPVVLLRGDMDALPVKELVDVDYASTHDGQMHACGHDLHVAALAGAARILHAKRDELPGDVVFMFQPAEETSGGAPVMMEEGLLDIAGRRVDAAYALHVISAGYPLGTWYSRPGPLMGSSDEFTIRVIGEGGHGSAPHHTKDPIPVACEMVLALQTVVARTIDFRDPAIVTVGTFHAGTKENIIPDDATITGTVRCFSAEQRKQSRDALIRLSEGVAAAHGLRVEVDWVPGYPSTINDDAEYELARETIVDIFGADRFHLEEYADPGVEDFAYVAEAVPSAYVSISACSAEEPATAPDNHSPLAHFDDSVLPDCAAFLAEVAIRRLGRAAADRGPTQGG